MRLAQVEQFQVPAKIVRETEETLRAAGAKGCEAFVLWSGRQNGPLFNILTVHVPKQNAISNNVGGVKHCLRTLRPALGKERHFALVDGFRFPTKGSLAIVAVRNSVRPNHLFDHNRDHDYYFELPVRGVGCPIITPVIYDAPWRCTGSPTCEPNFLICS